ncbi:MAG TPA: hypothetical protein VH092_18340 [Urbifossiella sp.]|nr:hypothetical protein [Urbifossiella sp.]
MAVPERRIAVVIRVGSPGQPAFQLRRGEEGLSVFDPDAVDPPLTEDEILDAFRPGSTLVYRTLDQITDLGLAVAPSEGADTLPFRLRLSHAEIRPDSGMPRPAFKNALKSLE